MTDEPTYTVTEDTYQPLKNGRGKRLIARKGAVLPWGHAHEIGLVSTKQPPKDDAEPKGKK